MVKRYSYVLGGWVTTTTTSSEGLKETSTNTSSTKTFIKGKIN